MSAETLISVSDEEINLAYEHFKQVFYPNQAAKGWYFFAFIGCTKIPSGGYNNNWEIPEQAAHYVNLLKGPHYRAIAKAMVINGHQYKERLK